MPNRHIESGRVELRPTLIDRHPIHPGDKVRVGRRRLNRSTIEVEELIASRICGTDVGRLGRSAVQVEDASAVAAVIVKIDPPIVDIKQGVIRHCHDRGLSGATGKPDVEGQVRPSIRATIIHLDGAPQKIDHAGLTRSAVTAADQEVVGGLDRPAPHFQHAIAATTGTDTKLGQLKVTVVQSIVPKASGALSDHEIINAGRGVDIYHTTVLIHRSGTTIITQHHSVPVGISKRGKFVTSLDVDSSPCPSHVTDPQGIGRKVSSVTEVHESVVHR